MLSPPSGVAIKGPMYIGACILKLLKSKVLHRLIIISWFRNKFSPCRPCCPCRSVCPCRPFFSCCPLLTTCWCLKMLFLNFCSFVFLYGFYCNTTKKQMKWNISDRRRKFITCQMFIQSTPATSPWSFLADSNYFPGKWHIYKSFS